MIKKTLIGGLMVLSVLLIGQCADKPTVPNILETTLSGKVLDAGTGAPIASATVSSEPTSEQVLTNEEGAYVLRADVEIGTTYRVTATATGYVQNFLTITAKEGETRIADLKLAPSLPELKVDPDTLHFDTNVESKLLVVENVGTGVLDWSVTVPSEDWLQATPLTGKASETAGTVTVTVDRALIEANGVYATEIAITSDGGVATIPITMVVEGKTGLSVAPVSLAFGTASDRKTIGITNTGSGDLTWGVSSGQDWITATPDSGITASGSVATQVIVEVDRSQLSPGEHAGNVDVVSSGGSVAIPITVSVPTPVLSLSTREIDFRGDLTTVTLEITNTGTGDLTWRIEHELPWLTIEPSTGITAQTAMSVVLSIQRQGLEVRSYDEQVRLTSNSTSEPVVDLRIKMQVSENPVLSVSPDSLHFGTDTEELSLNISNIDNGTLAWEAEVNEPWLTLNPLSGETLRLSQTSITATVQRVGLVAGTFAAQVTITSNGGRKTVPVSIEVSQEPHLSANNQTLDFSEEIVTQAIEIRNTGTGRLTWSVQEEASWLAVSPTTGTTLDETDQITFTVTRTDLDPGTYTANVAITSDGGDLQIVAEMVVPEIPNTVPIADAGQNQEVEVGDVVRLDGSGSSDMDGDELTYRWIAPSEITLSNTAIIQPEFTATIPGTYQFTLIVNDGRVDSEPDVVEVTVNEITEFGETLTVNLPGGVAMDMIRIEPGTFLMGSPSSEPGRDSDEGPQHEVTISQGFWLGKYEITQSQWESVMGTTPWVGASYVQANGSHPAVNISWDDTQTFVGLLNEAAGEILYRLPTEAEWEYAARAGTTARWSFGEDESRLGDYAWYRANAWDAGLQYAQPVGTKLPNPWGLYDMHGNVWEWVQDWYDVSYYSISPVIDPVGPTTGSDRVLRGGDFNDVARLVRLAKRNRFGSARRFIVFGVRLLRMAEPIPLSTGDAEIIGEIEEDTGDAEIIGEIEEDTGDAEIIGEIEEDTGDAEIIGEIEEE